MIHDILLACQQNNQKRLSLEEFLITNTTSEFIHPCEHKMFEDIVDILNLNRELAVFAKKYGGPGSLQQEQQAAGADGACRYGLYLNSFANGVQLVLQEFYEKINALELYVLQNPTHSLVYIYDKIQEQEPVTEFVLKLVRGVERRHIHGSAILTYLYQHTNHGEQRMERVMFTLIRPVKQVFIKQLTSWLLYSNIEDKYGEFFIQIASDQTDGNTVYSENVASVPESQSTQSSDIWHYELNLYQLPQFLATAWAEKVLFIGQSVLLFSLETHTDATGFEWNKSFNARNPTGIQLWQGKEKEFFGMLQNLNKDERINVHRYAEVINAMKQHVTSRLSKIAIEEINLDEQMSLIKDFYLLGRGELFLEFWRQVNLQKLNESEDQKINYLRAFEVAAIIVGVSDEMEKFQIATIKKISDSGDSNNVVEQLELKYKYKWPLNLLFSPKSIERYNAIFRFLLSVKKTQYDLDLVWNEHIWQAKNKTPPNIKVVHLRNQLMFFINNLQYYIQVDVLESQFSVLMHVIRNNCDFEDMQRSHSIFIANVLAQCFLLTDDIDPKMSITQSTYQTNHPVYVAISDIFHLCEVFTNVVEMKLPEEEFIEQITKIDERFAIMMDHLIKLLIDIKSCTSTPLLQLLLRLDYNHWFTSNKTNIEESI